YAAEWFHLAEDSVTSEGAVADHFVDPPEGRWHDGQAVRPAAEPEEPVHVGGGIDAAHYLHTVAGELAGQRGARQQALFLRARSQRVVDPFARGALARGQHYPERVQLVRLPGEPRPLGRETDWLRSGEAKDAVVSEGVGVGARRVAAPRHHQVLGAADDGHEALRVVGFREELGNHAGLYEALERRTSRHQVRPVADVALELPGGDPAQLEEALLEGGFVEARPGEGLGANRAQ